jgi:hypothetical protein
MSAGWLIATLLEEMQGGACITTPLQLMLDRQAVLLTVAVSRRA